MEITDLRRVRAFFATEKRTIVTIVSRTTGTRFTYRVTRKEARDASDNVWYIDVLTGPDNGRDYAALGVLRQSRWGSSYSHASASSITRDAPSATALDWFVNQIVLNMKGAAEKAFAHTQVFHEGQCGRCGLRLTTPESIQTGFGPVCLTKIGG